MASASAGGATNPGALLEELGRINPRFRSRAQQDSQEVLRTLVDSIDEEEQHRVRLRGRRREDLLASLAGAASAAGAAKQGQPSGGGEPAVAPAAAPCAAAAAAGGRGGEVQDRDAETAGSTSTSSPSREDGAGLSEAAAISSAAAAGSAALPAEDAGDVVDCEALAEKRASATLSAAHLARVEAAASWDDDEEAAPAPADALVPNELDSQSPAGEAAAAPGGGVSGPGSLAARGARPGGVPTWIWRLMGMRLCSMVRCGGCGRVSSTVETAFDLSVPLPPAADSGSASHRVHAGRDGSDAKGFRLSKRERRLAGQEAAKLLRSAAGKRVQRRGGSKDGASIEASSARGKQGAGGDKSRGEKAKSAARSTGAGTAEHDGQLVGGVQCPSDAWLKRASKRDLLQWLWSNAPPAMLVHRGLSQATPLKRLAGRVIATELIDAVREAVDMLREGVVAAALATAEAQAEEAAEAASAASLPTLAEMAETGSQTTASEWVASDVAERAAKETVADLLSAVEARVREEEEAAATAAAAATLALETDKSASTACEGVGALDPVELAAAAARAAVPELHAELPDGLVVPPCPRAKPGSRSLRACLAAFAAEDQLSAAAGNGYRCDACAAAWVAQQVARGAADAKPSAAPLQDATKRMVVLEPPHVLSVHVKRFAVSARGMPVKRADHVTLPRVLNLAPLCALSAKEAKRGLDIAADEAAEAARSLAASAATGCDAEQEAGAAESGVDGPARADSESVPDPLSRAADARAPVRYALKGVVVHQGSSLTSGHYVAAARSATGWVHASDTTVHSTSEASALSQQAYMCLYERVA